MKKSNRALKSQCAWIFWRSTRIKNQEATARNQRENRSPTDDGPPAIPHSALRAPHSALPRAAAYIPFNYISDSRQRIDIYRKLAQATEKPTVTRLRDELRDRFGPLPPPMELLLQVTDLKILASDRAITAVETKADRLMLMRNNDWVTVGGKFPRLARTEPKARLNEIKKLLLALGAG